MLEALQMLAQEEQYLVHLEEPLDVKQDSPLLQVEEPYF